MSYIGHIGHIGCVGGASGGHIGHIGHIGCVGGASGPPPPLGRKPTWLFLGAAAWRKPTWLFLGALGRTTGFFGARGGLLWGEPTWLFGSPHRGFWGVRRTLPQRFGAFTWCLHLVPSLGAFAGTCRRRRSSTADQPTGKPSAVAASRFSGEQRLNAWGV